MHSSPDKIPFVVLHFTVPLYPLGGPGTGQPLSQPKSVSDQLPDGKHVFSLSSYNSKLKINKTYTIVIYVFTSYRHIEITDNIAISYAVFATAALGIKC